MKKKSFFVVSMVIVALLIVLLIYPQQQGYCKNKVITLKCANYFPPTAEQSKIFERFVSDVELRTHGRIKIKYFPGGSLLKGTGIYKGIKAGIADIGFSHVYYTPGRMPVTEFAGLPFGYPTAWVASHVLNDFYAKFQPKEWNDVKLLWLSGSPPCVIISKKPVRKLEDLRGLNIRAPGMVGDVIRALGALPAPTPVVEVYDSMSKGVIDGAYLVYECLKTFRLAEVARYTTVTWQIGTTYPFYAAMNKRAYERLPKDLKQIFDELCGEYAERSALMWNSIDMGGKEFGAKKGIRYIELSKEEVPRWQKKVAPLLDVWTKKMVQKGYKGSEVKNWISFLKERIEYYTKEQIKYRIPSVTGPDAIRPENLAK